MTTPQSTPEGRAEHWEARWRGACERARDAAAAVDRLRAQVAHQGAYITSQGDALAAMERERDQLRVLVRDLLHPGPCFLDARGRCEAHFWYEDDVACPHARAAELLAGPGVGE